MLFILHLRAGAFNETCLQSFVRCNLGAFSFQSVERGMLGNLPFLAWTLGNDSQHSHTHTQHTCKHERMHTCTHTCTHTPCSQPQGPDVWLENDPTSPSTCLGFSLLLAALQMFVRSSTLGMVISWQPPSFPSPASNHLSKMLDLRANFLKSE